MRIKKVLVITFLSLLYGCDSVPTRVSDWWGRWQSARSERPVPQHPIRTDRFILPVPPENMVGRLQVTLATPDDTFIDIARRYDLGYEELRQANPDTDPWLPGAKSPILLPTQFILPDAPREGIVLNVATMRLYYFPERIGNEPAILITHPVGIGREDWPTPLGITKITEKEENPYWYVPASIRAEHAELGDPLPQVIPPGPDNPLGAFSLRLGLPGYLIHGTNKSFGVGMRVSHGCVRLYPKDIQFLFTQVPVGTPVYIVNQPILLGWRDGILYLEVHPRLAEDNRDPIELAQQLLSEAIWQASERVDWNRVLFSIQTSMGFPIPISPGSPEPAQVVTQAPIVHNMEPVLAMDDDRLNATKPEH